MGINRLQKLRPIIAEKGSDALLVSQPENCRYLSGFTGEGYLLISGSHALLATDSRYTEQAKRETQDFEIIQIKGRENWLPGLASDFGWHKLGFEANFVSYNSYHELNEAIKTRQLNLELIPTTDLVERLRSIKEPEELELIKKAVELTDVAFEYAKSLIHPSITEKKVAWEIEKFLRQKGSEGMPFDLIVASGANSALPHARPTEREIRSDEPVLIDMGARIGGYCSDFTRTLWTRTTEMKQPASAIYNLVLKAQTTAIERIKSDMDAAQADKLARDIIEQAGYGDKFGHSLGHGVGLAVHEFPALASNSTDCLLDGMVFTIEPGIYIPGWGGVRIEDMVILVEGKARVLTKSEKHRFQLSEC